MELCMRWNKTKKPERETHMRGVYEVLGKQTDVKVCKECNMKKSIMYFNLSRQDGFSRNYTKNICAECDHKNQRRVTQLHKLFADVKPTHCTICKKDEKLSPDHCHKTMVFRGWICKECNVLLGKAFDNPQILINAIEYLQKDHIPDPKNNQLKLFDEME